jgi:hypothetical protein
VAVGLSPPHFHPWALDSQFETVRLLFGRKAQITLEPLGDLSQTEVEQVLVQLRRGEAHITFVPATESVNVVVTSAIGGSGSPGGVRRFDADR